MQYAVAGFALPYFASRLAFLILDAARAFTHLASHFLSGPRLATIGTIEAQPRRTKVAAKDFRIFTWLILHLPGLLARPQAVDALAVQFCAAGIDSGPWIQRTRHAAKG